MKFKLEELVEIPALEGFHLCTRENLLFIADHYELAVSKQIKKQTIKAELP